MIVGTILRNRYRITRQLGSGGFGVTYLAEDEDLPGKPKCVVKHFKPRHPNPSTLPIAKGLFDREANVLYRLGQEHDQIPKLYAHFEEDGEFYLVQEYVHGHNLATEFKQDRCLTEPEVFNLLFSILGVLSVVHQHGVIHRDIKPPNLMRRYRDGKIVLIDFGAVKEASTLTVDAQGQTSITVVVGSSGYMPDEQANGKPKLCSDVYAVGMIGVEALTGVAPSKLPEDSETGAIIWRDRTNVSDSLASVLDKMIEPHFSQRYRSASEALQALLAAAAIATPHRTGDRVSAAINTVDPPLTVLDADTELTRNLSADDLSTSDVLTMADNGDSSEIVTSETVILSNIPTSISPGSAPLPTHLIDTPTAIAHPTETSELPRSSIVAIAQDKFGYYLSSLGSKRLMLGIGGIGAVIAAVLVSLSFSQLSTPNRSEVETTKPVSPIPTKVTVPVAPPKVKKGKMAMPGGTTYEGELVNGRPNGKGKIIAKTYSCEGNFRNGALNGRGFCNYKNGDRYEGEFSDNKFSGRGKIAYASGIRYEGEFSNDNLNGKGVLIYQDGRRDEGIWKDGELVDRKSIK
ncbi:protein kinase domain-containing protein [Pseudanabaena sp. PCC 6802]|uniref:protein kinase domain-containing protein n=1 Tax=Pseudanabaena sp. PCC 6802 TaxID=118173 RepID=UPI000346B739|nr:protein kinase [Pseudanabaena sp. PCC 6802]